MPRPKNCRRVECPPSFKAFRPIPCGCLSKREVSLLNLDEYEAIRLLDYVGLSQEDAARKMDVSRPTLTRIYDRARKVVAQALIEGRLLQIVADDVEFYGKWHSPTCNNIEKMKKLAISTTDGKLFPHFGKASQFTFVTIEDGQVINKETVAAPPHAHGVAPRFVISHEANVVIAGGMGATPLQMLTEAGVEVHMGAPALPIDDIIQKYIDGTLTYAETNVCDHHHHEHEHEQGPVYKIPNL